MTGPLGRIIEVVDAQTDTTGKEPEILIVMEHGEIDLAHLLARYQHGARDGALDDNYLRMYWQQMLEAVHAIHEQRVIHGDRKPANFLCVQGCLKLIDFGIASSSDETVNIARENAVGTLNYMSPEAIVGALAIAGSSFKVGRPSDVWSLGCILYQMAYGHTPFSHIKGQIQKLFAITNEKHVVDFPPASNPQLLEVMKSCLRRNPAERPSIPELLQHPLLRGGVAPPPWRLRPGEGGARRQPDGEARRAAERRGGGRRADRGSSSRWYEKALAGGGAPGSASSARAAAAATAAAAAVAQVEGDIGGAEHHVRAGGRRRSPPPGLAAAEGRCQRAEAESAGGGGGLGGAAASLAEQIAARRAHMGGAGDDDGNTGRPLVNVDDVKRKVIL